MPAFTMRKYENRSLSLGPYTTGGRMMVRGIEPARSCRHFSASDLLLP